MDATGFAALARAIEQGIAAQRVGTPVACRILLHAIDDSEKIPVVLARLVRHGAQWLRSRPSILWVSGDLLQGHWTTLIRMEGGESLLVTAGTRTTPHPIVEVTLYGNHGILSCESAALAGNESIGQANPEESERVLLTAVRQAIQTRQAVRLSEASPPTSTGVESSASQMRFDLFARSSRPPLEPPYGVLLVAGDHTHQPGYAEAFAADPRCQIVGVTDGRTDPDRRRWNEQYAQRIGARWFPDFQAAVSRPDVQIVSICAEPERRAALIVSAAQAGKHLYLDKPLCASVEQAAEIVAAVRKNRVLGHMFSQVLWDPAARVREILAAGELGELQAIHCDLCFAKGHTGGARLGEPRQETATPERFELPDAKRELTNIGVYPIVMLLTLLRRNVKRVFASTGNYFFAEHQQRDMEDFGQVLMELDGGITASLTVGRTGWQSHPSGGLHRITLIGERGAAEVDAHRPRVEAWSDSPAWSPPPRDPADPLAMWATVPDSPFRAAAKANWFTPAVNHWQTDVERFLNALAAGSEGEVTVEIAAAATEVLGAAYRSAATRRVASSTTDF